MKRPLLLTALALLAATGLAYAGAFVLANATNGVDVITHPKGYTGTGTTLNLKVCIDPTSVNGADMQLSLTNVVNTWNALAVTTGNLALDGNNNVPTGQVDWESTLLHEVGHCIGLAHPNLGTAVGVNDTNFTISTQGADSTYQIGAGTDGIKGSADDVRGDDVNLHWYRLSNNNPMTLAPTVDSTTYARAIVPGSNYAANADRDVAAALGFANTEAVMQQGQFTDEAQRTLVADDVATLRYGMSGIDEVAGTSDDYTVNLIDGGISSDACDITLDFDNAQAGGFALCSLSATTIVADHLRITSAAIFFDDGFNWFFNDEVATPTPTVTPTATATPTPTVTPTATATATNTPAPPTATPTATPTPAPTSTPTVTPTNTPGPSPTPTGTPTPGPSPTPTGTSTPGPSPTPTSTSGVPTATPTPTPTSSPTPGAGCGGTGGDACPAGMICVGATLLPNSGTCQHPTPTPTPTATITPVPTSTPTVTSTPTASPTPVAGLSVTSPGNLTINQGQTGVGGVFEVTNTAAADLSVSGVTIEVSDPTLFESMRLDGEVDGTTETAEVTPPTATTVFTFPAPLVVPPGETATFTLSVTAAEAGVVAGRVAFYATIVPASGAPYEGLGAIALFGLLLFVGAGASPRSRRAGSALLLFAIAAMAMGQTACGGGGGGGAAGVLSEQTISEVVATSGGDPATISGLPADLGDVRVRGAS